MQKANSTKKYAVLSMLALGIAALAGSAGHAYTNLGRSTQTARAVLAGAGTVTFSPEIRVVGTNATGATQIAWTGVTLPMSWKVADHYIALASTFTAASGGIELYIDNTAGDAGTFNVTGTPTTGGLVAEDVPTQVLPVGWLIQASTTAPTAADPNVLTTWFYSKDRAQAGFAHGEPYVTVANDQCATPSNPGNTCIHFASGAGGQTDPTQFGGSPSPNNIFLEANFATAVTPRTYGTNTLRLEAFTD